MSDQELVRLSLSLWINKLTTGDRVMSKTDFLNQGGSLNDLPKLEPDQVRTVERLQHLRDRITNKGLIFDGSNY